MGTDNVSKGAWMLDLEDIEKGGRLLIKNRTRESKSTKHVFKKGQILYSKLRPYLRKVLVADEDGYCTSEIIPITFMGGNQSALRGSGAELTLFRRLHALVLLRREDVPSDDG